MINFEKKLIIPSEIKVEFIDNFYRISGKKGYIDYILNKNLSINLFSDYLLIYFDKDKIKKKEVIKIASILNTNYIILKNHFYGVTNLYSSFLSLVGIGYKAKYDSNLHSIFLFLGFSKPIEIKVSNFILVEILDNVNIILKSVSKELVGKTALEIKNKKKADIYKGNGIRYKDEIIKFKSPKKSK